jgi:hypothetical protein
MNTTQIRTFLITAKTFILNNPQTIKTWIAHHPVQTVFHVVNLSVCLISPMALATPVFNMIGLTQLGPAAGQSVHITVCLLWLRLTS